MASLVPTAFDLLLAPGAALMKRLRFPAKTALLSCVLTVPLGWLTLQTVTSLHAELQLARSEVQGAAIVTRVIDLAVVTQRHRGLLNLALAGDATAQAPLRATRSELQAALAAVQQAVAAVDQFTLAAGWRELHAAVDALAQGRHPADAADAAESFALHSALIQQMRAFVHRSAEDSQLLLDPQAATFQLMQLTVEHALPWTEALAQMRGLGAGLLQRGSASAAERSRVVAFEGLLAHQMASATLTVGALQRSGEAATSWPRSAARWTA